MSNKIKATAFEVLQKKLTIEDTLEFREKHLQEILEAMEEYKNQNKEEAMWFFIGGVFAGILIFTVLRFIL
jgi:hypothetical protein